LNKYIKCNVWRLAVGTTYIFVIRQLKVNILVVCAIWLVYEAHRKSKWTNNQK
jgi:hypothetical protein